MSMIQNQTQTLSFAGMSTESILLSLLENDNRLNQARKINAFMQYFNLQKQQQSTVHQKAELLNKNITFFAGLAQAGIMAAAAVVPVAGAFSQVGSNAATAFAQAVNKGGDAFIENRRNVRSSSETVFDFASSSYNRFIDTATEAKRNTEQNSQSNSSLIERLIEKISRQGSEMLAG